MGLENLESHPGSRFRDLRSLLSPDRSLTNLRRLPDKLAAANTKFVSFMASPDDGGDRDEKDIYRDKVMTMVFTHERWENHRSTLRYAKHLLYMFNSNIFKALTGPICAVMLVSIFVGLYETLLEARVLPHGWPHLQLSLGQAFNLTAFAMSLLLVFRTNSSYDRWWEARKLWGGVVNRTRDAVRQGLVFYREEDVHLKELLARWVMAFPVVLMTHLRNGMYMEGELKAILRPEEIAVLLEAQHRPNFVLQVLAEINRASGVELFARLRLDENLTFFEDAMGSMERILRTPIPLSYTRHTSRFLLIWLLMLPFTLWAAYSWTTVLLSAVFSFLLLGIDEIGVQIEEPFGVLPIEAYCQTIERNIRELLSRNYDVGQLVLRQNLPVGGEGLQAAVEGGEGASAGGDDYEFGEMTAAPGVASHAKESTGASPARVVSLTASSVGGELGAGLAGGRRVRFMEGVGGSGDNSPTAASVAAQAQGPQRDMIEIELGPPSETAPILGQGGARSSSYATPSWLR